MDRFGFAVVLGEVTIAGDTEGAPVFADVAALAEEEGGSLVAIVSEPVAYNAADDLAPEGGAFEHVGNAEGAGGGFVIRKYFAAGKLVDFRIREAEGLEIVGEQVRALDGAVFRREGGHEAGLEGGMKTVKAGDEGLVSLRRGR